MISIVPTHRRQSRVHGFPRTCVWLAFDCTERVAAVASEGAPLDGDNRGSMDQSEQTKNTPESETTEVPARETTVSSTSRTKNKDDDAYKAVLQAAVGINAVVLSDQDDAASAADGTTTGGTTSSGVDGGSAADQAALATAVEGEQVATKPASNDTAAAAAAEASEEEGIDNDRAVLQTLYET